MNKKYLHNLDLQLFPESQSNNVIFKYRSLRIDPTGVAKADDGSFMYQAKDVGAHLPNRWNTPAITTQLQSMANVGLISVGRNVSFRKKHRRR